MRRAFTLALLASTLVSTAAMAAETVSYSYDARGRLVKVQRSGSVNNNVTTSDCYDRANNRLNRTVSLGGSVCTASGSGGGGTGGGTPTNSPPVASNDSVSLPTSTTFHILDVIANDSDSDGDLPLTLTAISGSSPYATVSVANGTSVAISTGFSAGTGVFTYTVQDSKGATSTGTLTVTVIGGFFPEDPPLCNGVPC